MGTWTRGPLAESVGASFHFINNIMLQIIDFGSLINGFHHLRKAGGRHSLIRSQRVRQVMCSYWLHVLHTIINTTPIQLKHSVITYQEELTSKIIVVVYQSKVITMYH